MKKSLIVISSALLFGVGAADVSNPKLAYDDDVFAGMVRHEDLRPRPARTNYPACRPGRGDDRCIQLYERGVRSALARWDRPTGGWNGEPVRTARAERRERRPIRGVDRQRPTPPTAYRQTQQRVADPGPARGGPVERRSDYPACTVGGRSDNCIQLRERDIRGGLRTGTPGI